MLRREVGRILAGKQDGGRLKEAEVRRTSRLIDERQSGGRERVERKSERSGAECGLESVTVGGASSIMTITVRYRIQCYYSLMSATS